MSAITKNFSFLSITNALTDSTQSSSVHSSIPAQTFPQIEDQQIPVTTSVAPPFKALSLTDITGINILVLAALGFGTSFPINMHECQGIEHCQSPFSSIIYMHTAVAITMSSFLIIASVKLDDFQQNSIPGSWTEKTVKITKNFTEVLSLAVSLIGIYSISGLLLNAGSKLLNLDFSKDMYYTFFPCPFIKN